MSTEAQNKPKSSIWKGWQAACLLALPLSAGLILAAILWGGSLRNLLHVLLKLVVVS